MKHTIFILILILLLLGCKSQQELENPKSLKISTYTVIGKIASFHPLPKGSRVDLRSFPSRVRARLGRVRAKKTENQLSFPSRFSDGTVGYGYCFWMWPDQILKKEVKVVNANGNGGQNIFWDLENDLIVVTTAGNYNKWDIKNDTETLLRKEIFPLFLMESQ